MKDILEDIIAHKRIEVEQQKRCVSMQQLLQNCNNDYTVISMSDVLRKSDSGIIAEFKRRSPSKGWINAEADSSIIPSGYEKSGATAVSILTDERFFGGTLKDIKNARPSISLPILRKDFIIDEYQIYQARIVGANAILLIASALSVKECSALAAKAHELQLEVLLEIHSEKEIDYIDDNINMVGVNNRNLGTFHTDVQNSFVLAQKLPSDMIKVSESGISDTSVVKELREVGYRGFLIGENFMKSANPDKELNKFILQL